jgi:hypothetical protein
VDSQKLSAFLDAIFISFEVLNSSDRTIGVEFRQGLFGLVAARPKCLAHCVAVLQLHVTLFDRQSGSLKSLLGLKRGW